MASNVIGIGPAWLDRRQIGFKNPLGTKNYIYEQIYSSILPCDCWDYNTSNTGHGGVFSLEFSPEGSLLVAACEKRSILVFDPLTHKKIHTMKNAHLDCVNCVKFLNSHSFATCSDDFTVALWDVRNLSQKVRTLKGHSNWVKNIEYSPQDDLLVTSGFDGTILTWEMNKYKDDGIIYNKVFSTNGLMRTRLTPDATKMIICTTGGYLIIIHNLDLSKMSQDLEGFKPNMYRLMQLSQTILPIASDFTHLFCGKGKRNRVEFVTDFPEGDDAEVVSSLQIHPDGHSAISRNVSHNEKSEWSCIHNIEERIIDESDGFADENKDYDDNCNDDDDDIDDHKDYKRCKILSWAETSHSISTTPSYIIQHSMFQNERSSLISRSDAGTNTEQNDLSVSPSDVWEALVAIQEARISRETERVTSEESVGHVFRHQAINLNSQTRSTNSENQYFVSRILPNTSTYTNEEVFHNLANIESNSQNVIVMPRNINQKFSSSLPKNIWVSKNKNKNLPLVLRYFSSLYRRSRVGQYDRTSIFRKPIYCRKIVSLRSKKIKNFKLNTKYEINETKRLLNESENRRYRTLNEIIKSKTMRQSSNTEVKWRSNFSFSSRNALRNTQKCAKTIDASTSQISSSSVDITTNTSPQTISLKKNFHSLKKKFINLDNANFKDCSIGFNSCNKFHKNEEHFREENQEDSHSGKEEEEFSEDEGLFNESESIFNIHKESLNNSHHSEEETTSSYTSGERTILMGVFRAGTEDGIRGTTMRRHNVAVVKVSSATQTGTNSMVDSLKLKRTTSNLFSKMNRNVSQSTKSSYKITENSSNKSIVNKSNSNKQVYNNCKRGKNCYNSSRYFSGVPVNKKIHQNENRLTHYIEEPNLGRGFIKEVCVSPDGRIVCSPFGNGIRLLSFSPRVQDVFYCYPHSLPIPLHELTLNIAHKDIVVSTKFSPFHNLLVSGCLSGEIVYYQPFL